MGKNLEPSKVAMELVGVLREIWDDDDFVLGVIVNAENDYGWHELLEYIQYMKKERKEVNVADIILKSLEVSELPDELIDVDINNEAEFAQRYAYTNQKVGNLMHDSDDKEYSCPKKYLRCWLEYDQKLTSIIIRKLEQEGAKISLKKGTRYAVMPFMERNGYIDGSGWWVKDDESAGRIINYGVYSGGGRSVES